MRKLFLIMLMAAMLIPATVVFAQEEGEQPETGDIKASIGNTEFSFTNEQEYFDVSYQYPDEFELEIKEEDDRVRHLLRYHVDGYDPTAVGLVISRTNEYTPEDRLVDIAFIDEITTEEIDGVPWVIGRQTDTAENSVIIYACAAGDYTYTFSFSTDYPADFDFTDFAKVFAQGVTIG